MIEYVAKKSAELLFNAAGEQAKYDLDELEYGLKILYNALAIILIGSIVGWLVGSISTFVKIMFTFAIIRFVSGGKHINSSMLCVIASVITFLTIYLLNKYLLHNYSIIIDLINLIIMIFLAPNGVHIRMVKEYEWALKTLSASFVFINILFVHNPLLTCVILVQCFTIIINWEK